SGKLGLPHAVALDSGTSALMLALRALQSRQRVRRVGIPAYCCGSVYYAVCAAGCDPVWMDCRDNLRLHAEQAHDLASTMDAMILVHPFGMVEPMAAESWPCPVIEDIAQSAGACLQGQPVGSFGDIAVASFHVTKPWGGAYGGMVLSRDASLCDAITDMRDPDRQQTWPDYAGHHQLSDLHAALAMQRIEVATEEQRMRAQIAEKMDAWFVGMNTKPVMHDEGNRYRYIVRTRRQAEEVVTTLRKHGIGAARPVSSLCKAIDEVNTLIPGAWAAWQDCVSLPLLPDCSEDEFLQIRKAVKACMT
ncbi:MAG: DegT/DnrJ/EryC1/StrS family aminotransferase, partial [Mariprofundaceae bacterium]